MFFFFAAVVILLVLDNYVVKQIKGYIDEKYKKTLQMINKLNPFYKEDKKHSQDCFITRISVIALYWLLLNLFIIVLLDFQKSETKPATKNIIDNILNYIYIIGIILSIIIYFLLNNYCKNNFYFRSVDMILSIIPTVFIIFVSLSHA